MAQCVNCGEPLKSGSRFCTSCGTQQPVSAPPAQHAPTTMLSTAKAILEIRDSDGSLFQLPLGQQPMTLGRAPDNAIVMKSRFVSSHHARIEPDDDSHKIFDTNSTNGLLFNGVRVPVHDFRDGDVVRIGDPVTGNFVTLTYRNSAKPAEPTETKRVTRFELTAPVIPIGREGALKLDNPQVSRRHAEIRAEQGGHVLRDLGSTNGSFVNGERISTHRLKPQDVIQIGPYKLVYDGRSLDQFDQAGAMRIDGRSLVRIVGGGKIILHNVSLVVQPREFIALVGGSGAGKSTLMGALSGYNRADKGMVLVNGDDFYANFDAYRNVLGFVPQDDILHRALPVETALRYTAKLRLPVDTAPAEIEQRIERVLDDVEMSEHRHKRIDQLSGGQRKRVSISSELLADPSLFFLDEPTSGLDPGLEKKMMFTLRRLADSGRTIVLVTHATANITQCDHVAFMAEGRMVWFGPPMEALDFFNVTSGDFADIYTKLEGRADADHPLTRTELKQEYALWRQHNQQAKNAPSLGELWEIRFRNSPQYQKYVWHRLNNAPVLPGTQLPTTPNIQQPGAYPTDAPSAPLMNRSRPKPPPVSALRQWWILTKRYAKLIAADRRNLLLLLLQAPIIGIILLLVAEDDSLQRLGSANGRMVPFLLGTVAVWFGIINSVREITKEGPVFKRERLANLKIVPYLASKVTVLSLLCFIQSVILIGILATEVDFGPQAITLRQVGLQAVEQTTTREFLPIFGQLGGYLVTTFLTSLTGLGLGLCISALVNTSDKAMSVVPFALVPQIVFALALLPLPASIAWSSYIVSNRWSMEGFASITQYLEPRDPTQNFAVYPTVNYDPAFGHVYMVWGILIAYTLICLAITAWLLDRQYAD